MNSQYQKYTSRDLISYTLAVLVFMFFSIFVFKDVGPDSNILVKIIRAGASFPYILSVVFCWQIIVNPIKHDLDNDDDVVLFITATISIILCILSLAWFSPEYKINTNIIKFASILGLIIYLYLHTIPSTKAQR